jgi:glyoxylase-like metal-dependent hydrolase (beta-lactamase superfamily II)
VPFIGKVEYHFINDGINWADGGGAFGLVPKVIWEKKLPPDEYNRIPLYLNCLLLKAEGKTILIDTGLGDKLTPKQIKNFGLERPQGTLLQNLAKLGLAPTNIDIVINTHLHADHCGGNTMRSAAGNQLAPTFPKAEYWIQRLEWADAILPNERTRATYLPENYEVLRQTGQLNLLSGDTPVVDGVRTVVTRGHTRAHQSILIESEGQFGFYAADLATLSYHFERTAWVTAYDVEPLENIETKRRWQRWAVETKATIMLEHDPHITTAKLYPDGQHFKLEPFTP